MMQLWKDIEIGRKKKKVYDSVQSISLVPLFMYSERSNFLIRNQLDLLLLRSLVTDNLCPPEEKINKRRKNIQINLL